MASRSLWGGQAPKYKFPTEVLEEYDCHALVYDAATSGLVFTHNPVISDAAVPHGTTCTATEDGGAGEFDCEIVEAHRFNLDHGHGRVGLLIDSSPTTVNLTGGGSTITIALPAEIAALSGTSPVCAIATVTDTVSRAPCYLFISGSTLTLERVGGTFTAGAATIDAFSVDYFAEPV